MEGWYYRLTLEDVSFAFIISIEDPVGLGLSKKSDLRLSCIQVVGPDDEYLVQADRDDTKFWAWEKQQGLGCTFALNSDVDAAESEMVTAMSKDEWCDKVESGFQIMPDNLLGRVKGHDGTKGGVLQGQGIPGSCDFDFSVTPLCGWGDTNSTEQKSTGGWLASFAVFEPHWQVTMADARATGRVTWKNRTYDFQDAKFYGEKNWGKALPSKWFWTQCNSFDGYEQLSVTGGGGIRQIPLGQQEALGMICVHYNGTFYEAVPWAGEMEWKVDTWGSWFLTGRSTTPDRPFEVQVSYTCDPIEIPGLVFRAPTPDEGMVYFCRDTFEANATLSLWELEWHTASEQYIRKAGPPLIDRATSSQGGAEVGGGPWWDTWEKESRVKQPIKSLLQFPFKIQRMTRRFRRS
jgi:tocopherol cyclase